MPRRGGWSSLSLMEAFILNSARSGAQGSVFQSLVAALIVAAAAFFVDQISKWLIVEYVMQSAAVIPITPFFSLTLGYNTGISFGLFSAFLKEWPYLLVAAKIIIVAGLFWWAATCRSKLEAAALGLIAGGATGNIVDRVRQGAVTDFLDFHAFGWHWPTFNLADTAIVLGATLLLAASFGMMRLSKAREANEH